MSPLVSAPNRGYPDYQRIGNYDQGVIYSYTGPAVAPPLQSGILDVSRFAYLGGLINTSSVHMQMFLNWFTDAAGSVQAGVRSMQIAAAIGVPMQIRFPNLGPFVQLSFNRPEGGTVQPLLYVFGTNRVHPLEIIPSNATLIPTTTTALAAPQTVNTFPNDYYSGPVQVWIDSAAQPIGFGILYMDTNGALHSLSQLVQPANTNQVYTLLTPPGVWAFTVNNQGGAATSVTWSVQHTTTGAM